MSGFFFFFNVLSGVWTENLMHTKQASYWTELSAVTFKLSANAL